MWQSSATAAKAPPTRSTFATRGCRCGVGLPEGSTSRAKAEASGLRDLTPFEACEEADLIVVLTPDHVQRHVYAEAIEPNLVEGDAMFLGHGFNIR